MKHQKTDRGAGPPGDDCPGDNCPGATENSSPVAGMDILMANEEDCQGSVDFWMARVRFSLRRNDKIP
jgi:hypothetical protein